MRNDDKQKPTTNQKQAQRNPQDQERTRTQQTGSQDKSHGKSSPSRSDDRGRHQ